MENKGIISIAFVLGFLFSRWDAQHGADYGFKFGKYVRENILRLKPLDYDKKEGCFSYRTIDFKNMPLGLYVLTWAEEEGGGTSLASVGMTYDGTRWYAPTNWTSESNKQPMVASTDWGRVLCADLIKENK